MCETKVKNNMILDGAIDSSKLAPNSISSANITDSSIVNADISPTAAITVSKLSTPGSGTEFLKGDGSFASVDTDAIEGILDLARESEHPRTYEVAGQLIKNVAEVTEKLGELQEKMKRLKEVPNTAPKNVTNALFVGSTAELQKMLKGKTDGHGNANSTTD